MDKVLGKVNQTRLNWWQAFKIGVNLKGYEYYKPPAELKYRYPAPGSVALDNESYPHLQKQHWKTPYRDSVYNIQKTQKIITDGENVEVFSHAAPTFDPLDPADAAILREQFPDYSDKKMMFDQHLLTLDERQAELWKEFEQRP